MVVELFVKYRFEFSNKDSPDWNMLRNNAKLHYTISF